LDEPDYAAACRRSLAVCGKKVSQQAFAIFSKIAEVDRVITPELQAQVFEVHREVCFWGFGRSAMQHRKKVALGYEERHGLLVAALQYAIPQRNEVHRLGFAAEPDDLLDATVAAFTAYRVAMGRAERIPREAEFDRRGLRMEMVY
jgi:predicted RNase H-like nuclease